MEMTLCVNYPVLRQNKGELLNTFVKTAVIRILSVHSINLSLAILLAVLMYNVVSFDRGVFRTYSIIHAYFALVKGSSHQESSPSILYPPCSQCKLNRVGKEIRSKMR